MKPVTTSVAASLVLLVALGYGCAADSVNDNSSEPVVTLSALSDDDGDDAADHNDDPDCDELRKKCSKGNADACRKYSKKCKMRIGVIGDSLSDEYQGIVSALPGLTWTEQLHAVKHVSFGGYKDDPSVRGEPRNDGHSRNWARFGQAALSPQWSELTNHPNVPPSQQMDPRLQTIGSFDAQIDGLAKQITKGKVDLALVWVGHNDLFIRTFIGYEQDGGQQVFFGKLITRIVTAAAALRTAATQEPNVVKTKVAIIGLAGTASALNPSLSAAAAGAGITFIDPFNTAVTAIATEQGTTGFYDVAGTPLQPFTFQFTPPSTVTPVPKVASLANLAVPGTGPCGLNPATNSVGCSTPAYAEPFTHYDGIHPNTLYMGAVGNQIVADVNTTFGLEMRSMTEEQLLDNAGL